MPFMIQWLHEDLTLFLSLFRSVEAIDEPLPITSNIKSQDVDFGSFQGPVLGVPMHLLRGV